MDLCVSRFHSFARIKIRVGQEFGFDAFDGGFDVGVQGGLVGEGTGAVLLGFEGF
jgi:L-aminopeptidase/D-esterase-like protein